MSNNLGETQDFEKQENLQIQSNLKAKAIEAVETAEKAKQIYLKKQISLNEYQQQKQNNTNVVENLNLNGSEKQYETQELMNTGNFEFITISFQEYKSIMKYLKNEIKLKEQNFEIEQLRQERNKQFEEELNTIKIKHNCEIEQLKQQYNKLLEEEKKNNKINLNQSNSELEQLSQEHKQIIEELNMQHSQDLCQFQITQQQFFTQQLQEEQNKLNDLKNQLISTQQENEKIQQENKKLQMELNNQRITLHEQIQILKSEAVEKDKKIVDLNNIIQQYENIDSSFQFLNYQK